MGNESIGLGILAFVLILVTVLVGIDGVDSIVEFGLLVGCIVGAILSVIGLIKTL